MCMHYFNVVFHFHSNNNIIIMVGFVFALALDTKLMRILYLELTTDTENLQSRHFIFTYAGWFCTCVRP